VTTHIVTHAAAEIVPVIRRAMKGANVTQVLLAEHLGISTVHMNRLLRGNAHISLDQLYAILAYLHLSIVVSPPPAK